MSGREFTRRSWLQKTTGVAFSAAAGLHVHSGTLLAERSPNERIRVGLIGAGWRPDIKRQGRGIALGNQVQKQADLVAISEVDQIAADYANEKLTQNRANIFADYRELLQQPDIDAVLIASPDHWHAKMAVDALRAGKHVYCEKPATLTIDEGHQISEVVKQTGRTLLVGTQQRTEMNHRFAKAVHAVRAGRIGQLQHIKIGIDAGNTGGPFAVTEPPKHLDYNMWLGPAPETPYIKERTHWTFRWWFEYAGGKLTDWGAHHVDIAHWALGDGEIGPQRISGTGKFQVTYEHGYAENRDTYNTPSTFEVKCEFPQDVEMTIHSGRNGIEFQGTEGRFFVNRGQLAGTPVKDMEARPLAESVLEELYDGPAPASHMEHFLDCVRTGRRPICDIDTHNRSMTTCHLANLMLRLNRPILWDAQSQQAPNDPQLNAFLKRESRSEFAIES